MRPTPRTDAYYLEMRSLRFERGPTWEDFARILERELAEAVEVLRVCRSMSQSYTDLSCQIPKAVDPFLKRMEQK